MLNNTSCLLYALPRLDQRRALGIPATLPFKGVDIWIAFELSWLNSNGKPCVAIAEFHMPCTSKNIVESKSFKLYLNSFSEKRFDTMDEVSKTLTKDLTAAVGECVQVSLYPLRTFANKSITTCNGDCLDDLDIDCDSYQVQPAFLKYADDKITTETLHSHLFRIHDSETGHPHFGSLQIRYTGPVINRTGLLKYIVSFRNHSESPEQCIEKIFLDIFSRCKCKNLTAHMNYTRRGGLSRTLIRSTEKVSFSLNRVSRQ